MQRTAVRVGIVLLLTLGLAALTFAAWYRYPWLFSPRYTIRVAVGPWGEPAEKFAAAFRREVTQEYPRIRLSYVQTPDLDASAVALKDKKVDVALVRSDNPMAAEGRTLAIVRKIAVVTILPPHSSADDWSGLAGKTIGVVTPSAQMDPLQKVVLEFYGVKQGHVRVLSPKDAGAVAAGKHVAALLAVGPPDQGAIAELARAVRSAAKKPPKFLDFDEADAIVARYPAYESLDIPEGAFVGSPPMPPDSATALATSVRLVSQPSLSNYAAGEITRLILATKARLAASLPEAGQIDAPDTDSKLFPIHPGTLAYLNGDKPDLLDESINYLFIGSMLFGAIGTTGAWLAAMRGRRRTREILARIASLPEFLPTIKSASPSDLDAIEAQLDELSEWLAEHYLGDNIRNEQFGAISSKIGEIRSIMARRRGAFRKNGAAPQASTPGT
jgi:TRAP-type uncharacterized transport system substrate-binding protein